MAEPARNYDDEESDRPLSAQERAEQQWGMRPREEEEAAPESSKPGARTARDIANERWGITPKHLRGAESSPTKGDTKAKAASAALTSGALATAEAGGTDQVGKGFTGEAGDSKKARIRQLMSDGGKRKKLFFGSGIGVAIVSLLVFAFLSILPLKILHIVENIQHRFFATSENAMSKEVENLLSGYFKHSIAPSLCKGLVVNKDCHPSALSGGNPVANLFKSWHDAKTEDFLKNNGIELTLNRGSGKLYLKSPGITNPDGVDVTAHINDETNIFDDAAQVGGKEVSRTEMRRAVGDAFANETRWKQVYYRFKVGRLLEEKYGIKRCIVACSTKDNFTDTIANKKKAAQVYLAERVLVPRSKTLGIVVECILLGSTCDPLKTVPDPTPGTTEYGNNDAALNGEPRSDVEKRVQQLLDQLAEKYGASTVEKVAADVATINEKGWKRFAAEEVAKKISGMLGGDAAAQDAAAQTAGEAVPVVGQVIVGSKIINALTHAGPKVKKLIYVIGSAAMIKQYMNYRTYADEMKSGHVDTTELGSFVNALGPGNHSDNPNDPIVGGTSTAESTPLYSQVIDGATPGSPTTASLLGGLLPSTAYAASPGIIDSPTASNNYLCNNGKSVPAGKLICPEESLSGSTAVGSILDSIHQFSQLPGINILTGAADAIANAVTDITTFLKDNPLWKIGQAALNLLISPVTSAIQPYLKSFISYLTDFIVPSPFGTNMSGGRSVDMMIGGADAAGSDSGSDAIGGMALSPAQVATIVNEQNNQAQQTFQHQSLYARVFDKTSQYSLVSNVAMALPGNVSTGVSSSVASLMSSPFSKIFQGFSSLFTSPAHAATAALPDAFGITPNGYLDSAIPADPGMYWDQHCAGDGAANMLKAWNDEAAAHPNPDTGMPEHHTNDQCLLIQSSIGSAGGIFSTSNLTADDLAGQGGSNGTVSAPGTLVWPFTTKSSTQYYRIDQGWDVQTGSGGAVYAVASGTIHQSNADPGGFGNDYPYEQLDSPINQYGWVYYGHVHVLPAVVGQHVNAGQLIAYTNTSNGQNGSAAPPGWLEIGFAQPGTGAPIQHGSEGQATQAGQDMKTVLINAQPGPGGGP